MKNMYITPIDYIILFGGGLSILMAITQIAAPDRRITNLNNALNFFVTGIVFLYAGYRFSGIESIADFKFSPVIIFLSFITGPFYYSSTHRLFIGKTELEKRDLIHLLPALVIAVITLFSFSEKIPMISSLGVNQMLLITGILHFLIYLTAILIKFISFWSIRDMNINLKLAMYNIIYLFTAAVMIVVSLIFDMLMITKISLALMSFLVIQWYVFSYRYPDLLLWFNREMKKRKYEKTILNGVDETLVRERLDELMKEERVFCDEDLTLERLAELLFITRNQLSEFLNSYLNMHFNTYVNSFRIEEAKKILIGDPERTILSIAMEVGFNSKSVFYNAFSKFTSVSPVKYRRDNLSK